ncbi:hypothetical protein [Roseovarius aestuariivivens]|uniref:hypothetical protein n=1 Tax=Roseovarius aestuariivivens TaxID=1888910 RepID=UPI0014369D23|nr:hypothetical protein [Roseovarius aestuariivivens]
MCLTTEAFALFLNIIGAEVLTAETDAVTIHATAGDVIWERVEDRWCTDAPRA